MEMSKAAIAPVQPHISDTVRAHPLFPLYRQHRSSMTMLLVQCASFEDWLYGYEDELRRANEAKHPRYPDFLAWMRANKGGARKCPAGNSFPHNFHFWLEGGRW